MKVLWFTTSPSLGSKLLNHSELGCSWIESLENFLSTNKNFEIGVAFLWKGEKKKRFKINQTYYYPINVDPLRGKLRKLYSRWHHKITTTENVDKYLEIVNDFKPDIIHIFGTENDYGMILPHIEIPCIVYIQGSLVLCNHKWYSGFSKREILSFSNKWQLIKGHGLYHSFYTNKKAANREKLIFKNSKFLIGRTDWDKRLSSVLSPNSKYFHCDEIMRQSFYSNQWMPHQNKDCYTVISVIRNNIYKGLENIIESQMIFDRYFPELNIAWKVAGINEKDEIARLVKKKYKIIFEDLSVQFLGPLREKELVREMINADLFVHPSHIENSPNSMCEAMLIGMPIIATSVGGVSSLLTNKEEGVLLQDGDPYSMAGAILELIKNKDRAVEYGQNARRIALERHDPNKIVEQIVNIYSSVIHN